MEEYLYTHDTLIFASSFNDRVVEELTILTHTGDTVGEYIIDIVYETQRIYSSSGEFKFRFDDTIIRADFEIEDGVVNISSWEPTDGKLV